MEVAWDRDALAALRGAVARADGAAVLAALDGRPLDDVLQLAGDGIELARAQGLEDADPLAARCAATLRARGLTGDVELADLLERRPVDLTPLPVDLEELSSILDGDPVHGGGRIDLTSGEVWHHSPNDDPIEDEDGEQEDEERWLWVEAGSRDGWLDMQEFAATVDDPQLGDRLERALHGRRSFRRFRAALDAQPEEVSRFHRFSDERQRGRARRWLAEHGYRPVAPTRALRDPPR